MSISDQALIDRVIKDDNHLAFAELVKRYQSQLRYSLRQLTGWNEALADDLAQETFIKAYRAIASFEGSAKFSSWLYRIAYNQMVSHFRVARNRELSLDSVGNDTALSDLNFESAFDLSDSDTQVSAEHYQQFHQDLAKAMVGLPQNQRMALHMHLHRECTQQEISDIMNIPLGTVKTLITRGKISLRERLADWQTGETP